MRRISLYLPIAKKFASLSSFRFCSASGGKGLEKLRNFGVSAHIDSGKTTLTERILYYCGKIDKIHEVRGTDGVGATMDSMDIERERGITIKSAATYVTWRDFNFNIIDTPGHIDFTIEVERSLKVLDGAVLVVCGVGGVQSQTLTVDRQMRRYDTPRIVFINKMDRQGADAFSAVEALRSRVKLNAAFVNVPIGTGTSFVGIVDLITNETVQYDGESGSVVTRKPFDPADFPSESTLAESVAREREALLERLADVDEEAADAFLEGKALPADKLKAIIRRCTLALEFAPVFCGAAKTNKGVQDMLDGVIEYLPAPHERIPRLVDAATLEPVTVSPDPEGPLLALAFKQEQAQAGIVTYIKVVNGTIRPFHLGKLVTPSGGTVSGKSLVRMHAAKMENVQSLMCGDVGGVVGLDVASGTPLSDGKCNFTMEPLFIPEPVVKASLMPQKFDQIAKLSTALMRFQKEDPSFRYEYDESASDIQLAGMGTLHLDVYVERLRREFGIEAKLGKAFVAYSETLLSSVNFNHLFKRQTGGRGQFAGMRGHMDPLHMDSEGEARYRVEYDCQAEDDELPQIYQRQVLKAWKTQSSKGPMIGAPLWGVRFVLEGGRFHEVDSSDMAFSNCMSEVLLEAFQNAGGLMEPWMSVEILLPRDFLSNVVSLLGSVGAEVTNVVDPGAGTGTIHALAPLRIMMNFTADLRKITQVRRNQSPTVWTSSFKTLSEHSQSLFFVMSSHLQYVTLQGMGEASLEYLDHRIMSQADAKAAITEFQADRAAREALRKKN